MVASLRDPDIRDAVERFRHFHHLQMVASLRGGYSWTVAPAGQHFHHLQMVASLRGLSPLLLYSPMRLVSTISRWRLH